MFPQEIFIKVNAVFIDKSFLYRIKIKIIHKFGLSKSIYSLHLIQRPIKLLIKGLWSSGYDVALTQRRSPVQIRLSPHLIKRKLKFRFRLKRIFVDN